MGRKYDINEYRQAIIDNNPSLTFKDIEQVKSTGSKVDYTCPVHGDHIKLAQYLYEGRGCSKCASDAARKRADKTKTFTVEDFITKSRLLHGDKYDYSKSVYTASNNKITIICPYHGEFEQWAYSHMCRGSGCKKCGSISSSKNSYLTTTSSEFTTLYYIKCYGKAEVFYKIGVAKNGVISRYPDSNSMPYLFEVLREIRGDAERLLEIERSIKLTIQPYTPLILFGGSATECTKEPIDLDQFLM